MPQEMRVAKGRGMPRRSWIAWLTSLPLLSRALAKEGANMPDDMNMSTKTMSANGRAGHLYMQTNEVKNVIVHYHRSVNGALTEVERVATGGPGSGVYKPISNQDSAPNSFEGAGSVIL